MEYKLEPSYKISFKFRRILVPFDGSGPSINALELALDWSLRYGSSITVAIALPLNSTSSEKQATHLIKLSREITSKYGKSATVKTLEYDPFKESPSSALVREALEGSYDVIIIGARGTTPLEDINLGSVALSLIHNTLATIVIVR